MATMTKYERVMRTVRFQETDRVPLYDVLVNDAVIEHYAGRSLSTENGRQLIAEVAGQLFDISVMPYGPDRLHRYMREDGLTIQQERWTYWVAERPFDDLPSLKRWVKQEILRVEAQRWTQADTEQLYQSMQTVQRRFAKGDPTDRDDPAVLVISSGIGLTQMYRAAGIELFSYLLVDEPGLVEAWLDARYRAELRRAQAIADPDVIPIVLTYDDIAHKNGLFFSPRWLRKYWLPRLRGLQEVWHERGSLCMFYSDGNIWQIIDDLVGAGIDGLTPLDYGAGMTVKALREKYPQLFLAGGVDVSHVLPFGTPDEVRAASLKNIADSGGRGYFLGSSTELHHDVPLANARAMYECQR